jgi:hypothetical protein
MKRILLLLLVCTGFLAKAQVYNNEWIDYSKTYYKFKVGSNGLYRISQASLNSIGLGSTPAENFQLWRNGQEIPLYTSVATGPLGSSDYIEFWGEMNDGKADKQLYRDPDYQLNDHWSLQTDTAFYFLTVNTGSNKRLVSTTNNIAGNTLSPEPYFMHTLGNYFRNKINSGFAALVQNSYVYSSAYDKGEGWTSGNIDSGATLSISHNNLHVYAAGPDPIFRINAAGNAINARSFRVKINNTTVAQQTMDYFEYLKYQASFSLLLISSGNATVDITNVAVSGATDRMVVAQYEINYPRQFDFDNAKNFSFELPANTNGNYLEISNFNYGSTAPVLYDITNGKTYVADISNPALIKIALQPSSLDRKLILVSEDASNIGSVTSFQTSNFINYGLAANEGNYLIIANSVLFNGANGSNPVDDYKVYRSSVAGGSYNTKVYDIDQLIDQFAFGIKKHPSSIRNFIQFALNNYSTPPKFVFLMGKGVNYLTYRNLESSPTPGVQTDLEKLNLVPTFGNPASDNLLSCFQGNNIPVVPVARLSVINASEVAVYLKKVKDYELSQAFSSPYIADKAWIKNIIHVVGADNGALETILNQLMSSYKNIISDTLFGGNVNTFSKASTESVEQINSQRLQNLFQEGLSIILYFGHSSASSFEFNLDDPMSYNNFGKYPIFITLGCNAGNLYNFNQNRFLTKETISENFVLAPDRGAIAFLATTSLGIVQYLDILNTNNYKALGITKYGKTIGEIMQEAIARSFDITTQFDFYARVHCEQISLNGDPALKYNTQPKPDYVIEEPMVKVTPTFISTADGTFKLSATMMNMGKAVSNNIVVEVKRTYPNSNNVPVVIHRDTIPGIRYMDSISIDIPIIPDRDKGLNKITITVDADDAVSELYENNNSVTKDVFIYDDDIRPVYPYNFAIINKQNIKLVASTANPFAISAQYKLELDTTELFNSSFKITKTITSKGGVIEFNPGITFIDGVVYYWRVAPIPVTGEPKWNSFSFIYLANEDLGFNQSHFYQHLKSGEEKLYLDSTSRTWKYGVSDQNLFIRQGTWVTSSGSEGNFAMLINSGPQDIHNTCWFQSVAFSVFNPVTFKPWINTTLDHAGPTGHALYGSVSNDCNPGRQNNFEYRWDSASSRKRAMDFMKNTIPDGSYVVVRSFLLDSTDFPSFASMLKYAPDWQADETIYGPGQSLYHYLKNAGFSQIDSFNRQRNFVFVYKKNDPSFTPQWVMTQGTYDNVSMSVDCFTNDTAGTITSPLFGPAKQWKQLHWRGNSQDSVAGDNPIIDVYGVEPNGSETLIFTDLTQSFQDYDISDINANVYPYVRLKMRNVDPVNFTPYQMSYWRVTYVPVPEGAIAPNITFQLDSVYEVGQPLDFKIAFKNVSEVPFDSLKVKMIITDRNNVADTISIPKQKPLLADSTLTVSATINTASLAGLNNLYVFVNPDFDQPEQYLFNNFAYKNFYVRPDSLNPLLDVTFDGVHILNKDIIQPKPHILVKLKDEAKWIILSDTSLLTLKVRFPDGSLHRYYFNSDTMRFTPAGPPPNANNTATIDFLPYFTADGNYELIITGKDMNNNQAGKMEYRIGFQIINKPMISNMFNYPNPFTTSTAFVFTLTGSEVPQNLKIEIMTITGKIVREITKDELGPLHIGRNITEFKWDGTDQYGEKLANGIYLYRVITNLNGKSLDKYKAEGDDTDKYFNKGYGKMYLMR